MRAMPACERTSPWVLLYAVDAAIAVSDVAGVVIHANAPLAALTGIPVDHLIGSQAAALFDAAGRDELEGLMAEVARDFVCRETRMALAHGRPQVLTARISLRAAAGANDPWVIWTVTAAPPAPGPSQVPNPASEAAIWGDQVGLWNFDVTTDEVHWSNDWCRGMDLDPCEGPDHVARWNSRIHPDDLAAATSSIDEVIEGRTDLYEAEYRLRNRRGEWRWVLSRGRACTRDADARALRLAGVSIDIDARKRAEIALREAEERLETAVWGSRVGLWDRGLDGQFRFLNDWGERFDIDHCNGPDQSVRWRAQIHPQDAQHHARIKDDFYRGGADQYDIEYRVRTRGGEWRWLLERGRALTRDPLGNAERIVGVCIDIEEQKQLQARLQASQAQLETAIAGSDVGLWDWNLSSGSMTWLSDWPERFGIAGDSRVTRHTDWLERVHPDDRSSAAATIAAGRDHREAEYRVATSRGEFRWIHERRRIIERDAQGRASRMVGACLDVHARREAEELLRTQAKILETMREGVVLIDAAGRIALTNPAFAHMFGFEARELMGTSITDLLAEQRSGAANTDRLLRKLLRRTDTRNVGFARQDGSEFTGEIVVAMLRLSAGRKWLMVVEDVSDRKRLEQEVLDISNRERLRIGYELHDGICQELTGVALILRGIATHLQRGTTPTHQHIEDIVGLVNNAIDGARAMARGLSPLTVDRGGLLTALDVLVRRLRQTSGIKVTLQVRMAPDGGLDESTAAHLYRIAQEALQNAVKHSGADAVVVRLRSVGENVHLSIWDNGAGMASRPHETGGMGLKIMDYRARMIGGVLQVESRRGRGTCVRCLCPLWVPGDTGDNGPMPRTLAGSTLL